MEKQRNKPPPRTLTLLLTSLLTVAGCISLSQDPRYVGTFDGGGSESLVFESDARVVLNRIVDGRVQRDFVGYAMSGSNSPPGSLGISGPDTSRFLGTSFQFSEDFQTVTVKWGTLVKTEPRPSQTVFHRQPKG